MTSANSIAVWDLPSVSGRPVQGRRPGPTVGELEAIEKKAHDEAYAVGHAAGLAAAKTQMQPQMDKLRAQVASLQSVIDKLAHPLEQMDAEVTEQLARLSMSVAKQVIRRELRLDPSQIIAVMRETVALLPASARQVRVHMHPDDAAVVREHLAAPGGDRAWSIAEDPMMTRGGCTVVTDTSQVDARVESRIASVASAMLGEQRTESRTEETGE